MPAIALAPDEARVPTKQLDGPDPTGTDEMAQNDPDDAPLLFCPFCRECFEKSEALVVDGALRCPDHELTLVPFDQLPKSMEELESELPADDESLTLFDPRFGRGFVLVGAGLLVASFATTFVELSVRGATRAFSGFAAAADRAPNLWTVPFVAVMLVAILGRRRSLAKMRGARLSILLLSLAPLFALAYSYWQVVRGAAAETEATGALMTVSPGLGVALAVAAAVSIAIGAYRLGIVKIPGMGPAPADPERASPIVQDEAPKRARKR